MVEILRDLFLSHLIQVLKLDPERWRCCRRCRRWRLGDGCVLRFCINGVAHNVTQTYHHRTGKIMACAWILRHKISETGVTITVYFFWRNRPIIFLNLFRNDCEVLLHKTSQSQTHCFCSFGKEPHILWRNAHVIYYHIPVCWCQVLSGLYQRKEPCLHLLRLVPRKKIPLFLRP